MEVPAENINVKASEAMDPKLPTKVIVHGFGSSCDHVWVYELRAALMAVVECNIGKDEKKKKKNSYSSRFIDFVLWRFLQNCILHTIF